MAHFLDGFPRYPKMHPCGLVLSRQPMNEITPCFASAKGYPTTHFDMDSVEAVGLVKMDVLAQGGLAVMRDVKEMLEKGSPKSEIRSPTVNLDALEPWDDPHVWELIARGQARAVHHIESPAMISLCKMCNVRDIDTLIAIVSVIRPGAANESKKMEFARRYQGLSPVRYPHPSLQACLHSTYGLVVYEEHILQICEAFAGLPPGRADILRRALGKEKADVIDQIQTEFADCARRRGRTEAEIAEVWNLVFGLPRLRLLQGTQHSLWCRGLSIRLAQAPLSSGVHGGGAHQRERLLFSARLCAGMPPAGHPASAAVRESAGTAVYCFQ